MQKSEIGRLSFKRGRNFELRVRKELEKDGWFVSRWANNVEIKLNKLVPSKQGIFRRTTTGFPDFIIFRRLSDDKYEIFGVECKIGKYLDKTEKLKCKWLLENKVFSKIIIAYKNKKRQIEYEEFKN